MARASKGWPSTVEQDDVELDSVGLVSIPASYAEFILDVFAARLGDPYVYGGVWSPTDPTQGCDCSGLVGTVLEALTKGSVGMNWNHNVSTESWPYDYGNNTPAPPGTVGPYNTIAIASPADAPADAALIVNIHHGGGGVDSHTNCYLPATAQYMESNGTYGTCTGLHAIASNDPYWSDHWYLPGPIDGSVTPVTTAPSDTLWADVSEFQAPVNDSYWASTFTAGNGVTANYQVLAIRSNDGAHVDENFAANYRSCVAAVQSGKALFFIVYYYWRPDGSGLSNHQSLVSALGGPHPQMVSMMDVESGGNGSANQSTELTREYNTLVNWLGDRARVIGYGNTSDLTNIWPQAPAALQYVIAGYGANPSYPGKFAHQYTDGEGYGDGLPEGAPPFGNCDMNSADGISPTQLADALGVGGITPAPPSNGDISMADAQSITSLLNGNDAAAAGDPWRLVTLLETYTGPGQVENDPTTPTEAPWLSPSIFDQISVLAKILTRRTADGKDLFDLLVDIHTANVKTAAVKK